uniref:Uncharacterized protein n=1 Tax=Rhizophora mucronata TaxID=61149 RepID=A0A2P2QXA8_RHIMU
MMLKTTRRKMNSRLSGAVSPVALSALSKETFLSAMTNFFLCSSFNKFEFLDFQRGSIVTEFCRCEGWQFGLCRRPCDFLICPILLPNLGHGVREEE